MENLPRFMLHVRSVQCFDDRRSHWIVNDPAGMLIEWDAEIITDVKNEHFSWQSAAYADVYNAGSVHFQAAPEGRGIEVKVVRHYTPPASAIGIAFATLLKKTLNNSLRTTYVGLRVSSKQAKRLRRLDSQPEAVRSWENLMLVMLLKCCTDSLQYRSVRLKNLET